MKWGISAVVVSVVFAVPVGLGHPLLSFGLLGLIVVTVVAAVRPGAALCVVTCSRLITDLFANDTSQSLGTTVATIATLWVCAVAFITHPKAFGRLRGRPILLFALFLGWVVYRSLHVAWTSAALRESGEWVTYLAILVTAAAVLGTEASVRNVARLIVWLGVVEVLVSLAQYALGKGLQYGTYDRVFGTFPHPGWLAFFLSLGIIALPVTAWPRSRMLRFGAFLMLGVVLTFSRGELVMLFVWAVAFAFLSRRTRIAVQAGAVGVGLLLIPAVRDRFLGEITPTGLTGSYESRTLLRELAIHQWQQSPWVGNGTASFFAHFSPIYFNGQTIEAHSDIFKLLVDQGIIGLALYLLVLWAVFKQLRRAPVAGHQSLAAMVVTLVVMGVLDVYYRMNTGESFLWLLLGAAVGTADSRQVAGDDLVRARALSDAAR